MPDDQAHPNPDPAGAPPAGRIPAMARVLELIGQLDADAALDELRALRNSPDKDLRPRATLLLAWLYEVFGHLDKSLQAYADAADSGHPEVAPYAALKLGRMMLQLGDVRVARNAFKQATRAADPQVRADAEEALAAPAAQRRRGIRLGRRGTSHP